MVCIFFFFKELIKMYSWHSILQKKKLTISSENKIQTYLFVGQEDQKINF